MSKMNRWRRLRKFRRKHRQFLWRDLRWPIIGGITLLTFFIGFVGFSKYSISTNESRSILDNFYLTLQLFILESGSVTAPLSWELELARWLAPLIAAYTALIALGIIFREQFQLIRLRLIKDHIIICGFNSRTNLLAKRFYEHGYSVVKIKQNEEDTITGRHKERGIIVLSGDARNDRFLYKARVHKAKYLILFCDDDGTNVEIAVHARKLVRELKDKILTCIVHLVDPWLCQLLREKEIGTEKTDTFRLEFLDIFDSGARTLLNEFPPFKLVEEYENYLPHVLIIGVGQMGESLLLHIAKKWKEIYPNRTERFCITIIDKVAEQKLESLYLQYPQLKKICHIIPMQMNVKSTDFQRAEFLFDNQEKCNVTSIYVCLDDDSFGLSAALVLQKSLGENLVPIVVRMTYDSGLATLIREKSENESLAPLNAFCLLDRTCEPELLLGGINETIARAIHEDYIDRQQKQGSTPLTNPSMVPWDELPENLKESNRLVADNIIFKLKAIGCGITPLADWDADSFVFKPAEIERMAEMEHTRWMSERLKAGWTYKAGKKNIKKKTSPYLVSWSELPAEIKQMDRDIVIRIPKFLSKVDLQVYRQ